MSESVLIAHDVCARAENEVEQLACVMEVLGLPPKRLLEQVRCLARHACY
eukprot:COSAG01_NODE_26871_length_700_cov_3.855241_2_plen_50_part_00